MAGTNAVLVKQALLALFKTALAPVRVDDAFNGRLMEREYVYFGHIGGPQEPLVFRAAARQPRQEDLTVDLHIEVMEPSATTVDTDLRVTALGQIVEEVLAADPTEAALVPAVPGLMAVWVSNVTLTSFYASDGVAATEGVYQISVQSQLR
jgi:hypothetical protein